jgi:hypothetical protein
MGPASGTFLAPLEPSLSLCFLGATEAKMRIGLSSALLSASLVSVSHGAAEAHDVW